MITLFVWSLFMYNRNFNKHTTLEELKKIPKVRSLVSFLQIALLPVGSTMYVYGGGWNEADTGAGIEAVTLGLSPKWAEFASIQDASYDHTKYRYQIHKGLDCSGYVGWVLYNTLEEESGCAGYVMPAACMAETFATWGFGTFLPQEKEKDFLPGDIVSMKDHVWISLGTCQDGSVVLVHASPPGVSLCGTTLPTIEGEAEKKSQAVCLVEKYMQIYFPEWYKRYPNCSRGSFYKTESSVMRWDNKVLADPDGVQCMSPERLLALLLNNSKNNRWKNYQICDTIEKMSVFK